MAKVHSRSPHARLFRALSLSLAIALSPSLSCTLRRSRRASHLHDERGMELLPPQRSRATSVDLSARRASSSEVDAKGGAGASSISSSRLFLFSPAAANCDPARPGKERRPRGLARAHQARCGDVVVGEQGKEEEKNSTPTRGGKTIFKTLSSSLPLSRAALTLSSLSMLSPLDQRNNNEKQ